MAGYGRATYWASESLRPLGTAADVVIRADFFGVQGAAPPVDFTATGVWTQAEQTLTAAGSIVITITGTATLSQEMQALVATGAEILSGTAEIMQEAQFCGAVGEEAFTGTGAWAQEMQSLLAEAAESFSAEAVLSQSAQEMGGDGEESFSGEAVLIAAAQEILAEGEHVPVSSFTGTVTLAQALQILSASGSVMVPSAPHWRGPRNIPLATRRKLYVKGRKQYERIRRR